MQMQSSNGEKPESCQIRHQQEAMNPYPLRINAAFRVGDESKSLAVEAAFKTADEYYRLEFRSMRS
jgi:hypothetical protein